MQVVTTLKKLVNTVFKMDLTIRETNMIWFLMYMILGDVMIASAEGMPEAEVGNDTRIKRTEGTVGPVHLPLVIENGFKIETGTEIVIDDGGLGAGTDMTTIGDAE